MITTTPCDLVYSHPTTSISTRDPASRKVVLAPFSMVHQDENLDSASRSLPSQHPYVPYPLYTQVSFSLRVSFISLVQRLVVSYHKPR